MLRPQLYFWKQMPFVRILLPFIAGIILQWKFNFSDTHLCIFLSVAFFLLLFFELLPIAIKYSWRWLQGSFVLLFMGALGALVTFGKDIKHNKQWVGNHYKDSSTLLVTLLEPLVEKANSYKAEATVAAVKTDSGWTETVGKIIVYFKKEGIAPSLGYGSQIIFQKNLQPIKNSGNPGAFDYARFNAFQNIYYQVFVKKEEYVVTNTIDANGFRNWLLETRQWVINKLENNIKGEKELGVAEALLIGYKNNLDKDLVQAYSNTGVVHIIAISGLHLGMIYLVLILLLKPLPKKGTLKYIRPVMMLAVLWIFALLAGAAPSIMRSAVMFSFIIVGESLGRKTSVYNTLAASAFLLLVYNPYYLWAVGFQLSYAAVLSIVTFMQPVYKWFYIKNKLLDFAWKLSSITLSAQVLTFPIIIFYFHQFANLFFITNLVVVPIATIVLYSELALMVFSSIEPVSNLLGGVVSSLIHFMNNFIERMSQLPFSVSENIHLSSWQILFLFMVIIAFTTWLLKKNKMAVFVAAGSFIVLVSLESWKQVEVNTQKKLIIYHVPQHHAMDYIDGNRYKFIGDSALIDDDFLRNFHLSPARIVHRISPQSQLATLAEGYPFTEYYNKRMMVIDQPMEFSSIQKIPVDIIVLTKNPKIYISKLATVFDCKLYVFDGSNPMWKINLWKKDCDSLHLRHYSTADNGALELDFSKEL